MSEGETSVAGRPESSEDTTSDARWDQLATQLNFRVGHFELESGHHGEHWFDLELLYRNPEAVRPLSVSLANRLAAHRPDVICGPLVEGAFVAMQVASELGVDFVYTERRANLDAFDLFPIDYQLPGALRCFVAGRRVAIANDIINAGSAVRGTLADLIDCSAIPVAIGSLVNLGEGAAEIAADASLPLETLVCRKNSIFEPERCPHCKAGVPLVPHHGS